VLGPFETIARFEDVNHAQDAAGFARVRKLDFDLSKKRLLFEESSEFRAVDR
jgi:hypothetical protein